MEPYSHRLIVLNHKPIDNIKVILYFENYSPTIILFKTLLIGNTSLDPLNKFTFTKLQSILPV